MEVAWLCLTTSSWLFLACAAMLEFPQGRSFLAAVHRSPPRQRTRAEPAQEQVSQPAVPLLPAWSSPVESDQSLAVMEARLE